MWGRRFWGSRFYGDRFWGEAGLDVILVCDDISRDLAADTSAEIIIDYTRPVYLVKMEFATASQFMSTGPQVTFDADVYVEGQVHVGTFTWTPDGIQKGRVQVYNENNAAAALILNEGVNDIPITIWITYLIAGGGNTTPTPYCLGSMNGGALNPTQLSIEVMSTKSAAQFLPNRYYSLAENFNHMPVDGSTITWSGEKFILEKDRG